MEEQKKNLDIRLILDQLNIPIRKFEEWQTNEKGNNRSHINNTWMISEQEKVLSFEK